MSFAGIKGQDRAIGYLKSSIKNNTLSHAYIFTGKAGVGKFLAALNFVKALNCDSPAKDRPYEGCDECASCRKIDGFSHPDLFILRPDKEGSFIGIDDIRALIKNISLRPFEGRKKVYIIDGAHNMKHEAANALLKTLEEPPADSMLILITDNIKALIQTIVSRSQVVRFFPLGLKEIEEILKKEYSVPEAPSRVLSHLSSGSLNAALKLKDEDMMSARCALLNNLLQGSLMNMDLDDLSRDRARLYLDILLSYFRDMLNVKVGREDSTLINIDRKDAISSAARRISFEDIEDIMNDIVLTVGYLDQNANQKLAMGVLAIKLNAIRNTHDAIRTTQKSIARHKCTK